MRVEIVSIGEELVLGEIADTNARHIGRELAERGIEIARTTVVGDDRGEVAAAFGEALSRADVVLATGGLGPTEDDLTREGLADALGVELVESPEARDMIARYRRGVPPSGMDLRQARVPRGADIIPNPRGTAPGIRAEREGRLVFVMPGVPHEMKGMFSEQVLPEILSHVSSQTPSAGRVVRTTSLTRPGRAVRHLVVFGVRESDIAARVAGIESEEAGVRLGTRATDGVITVRVVARGETDPAAEEKAAAAAHEIRKRLGEGVVAEGDRTLAEIVAGEATAGGITLAVAESCTGGMIAARLVAIPGVSSVLLEGVVAYSDEAKTRRLGVPPELIAEKGAVSPEVARAMAEGARRESGADVSVAVTGIAGPGGGTPEKPVGLVYLAASSGLGEEVIERRFVVPGRGGDREHVRRCTAETALWMLLRHVRSARGRADVPPEMTPD
jgi:nicotinamide-nucleotide amidase